MDRLEAVTAAEVERVLRVFFFDVLAQEKDQGVLLLKLERLARRSPGLEEVALQAATSLGEDAELQQETFYNWYGAMNEADRLALAQTIAPYFG